MPDVTKWIERVTSGRTVLLIFAVVTVGSYLIVWNYANHTNYVASTPLLYSKHVIALLTAGAVSAVIGYLLSFLEVLAKASHGNRTPEQKNILIIQAILIFVAAVCASGLLVDTWRSSGKAERWESGDLWALGFALAAVVASYLEERAGAAKSTLSVKGWAIELPLMFGIAIIVLAKGALFERGESLEWLMNREYFPTGYRHNYERTIVQLTSDLRTGFWIGTGAGVLAIQLMVAGMGGAFLKLFESRNA